ncbi:MAG: glycerol-3-phosphate 1-O-acyltransferase PlsY [Oscillospiraceae bacterium]|nr:glycerol-3-phosphate 1-O-acyltransferase PlsY [Oscillospiraceae bacterium]
MGEWMWLPAIIIMGYLIGSLNGSILLSKVFFKDDIRKHGSGNAGATNVLRVHGKKWTFLVSAWDMGKGALAVLLGRALSGHYAVMHTALTMGVGERYAGGIAAGIAVILGHVFPVWFGFRGGKGVITACMVMLMLDWKTACIALAFFFALVFWKRYISLGSIAAVITLPVTALLLRRDLPFLVMCIFVMVLIIFLHKANIKRLLSGTENKFGKKAPSNEHEGSS